MLFFPSPSLLERCLLSHQLAYQPSPATKAPSAVLSQLPNQLQRSRPGREHGGCQVVCQPGSLTQCDCRWPSDSLPWHPPAPQAGPASSRSFDLPGLIPFPLRLTFPCTFPVLQFVSSFLIGLGEFLFQCLCES